MKRFFKFAISIFSLLSLSGCPPWVSVNEAASLEKTEPIEILDMHPVLEQAQFI